QLEKTFPEESKKLRIQLEKEVADRFRSYEIMADPAAACKIEGNPEQ
ncbi:MAG: hypothetical protein JRH15_12590, partial [Deltaproteobacteria bacterium]|nr:hypothetical protein [Deltaproteobacteria bacterium]